MPSLQTLFTHPGTIVLVVFIGLVFAVSRGCHLGVAAFVGAVITSLWSGSGIIPSLLGPLGAAFAPDALLLAATLVLILGMSALMKATGAMERIAASYRVLARTPSFAIATLPGILGALPMPGGAGLSAPLVAALDRDGPLSEGERAAANYFFRHTVELVWPLYPSFILTCSLSGLSVPTLVGVNIYSVFTLLASGWFFLLRVPYGRRQRPKAGSPQGEAGLSAGLGSTPEPVGRGSNLLPFLAALFPIILAILAALLISFLMGTAERLGILTIPASIKGDLDRYFPILGGIALGCASMLLPRRKEAGTLFATAFTDRSIYKTALMVVGIKAFSGTLTSLGLASIIASDLSSVGLGSTILVALLPFLAGLVTGVGFGYVGISLPIVLAIASASKLPNLPFVVALANASGYFGMMISPLHVCAAVSAGYFKVPVSETLRRIVPPVATFFGVALLYAWGLGHFL